MQQVFSEIIADEEKGREQGRSEERMSLLMDMVRCKEISIETAAERAGMSAEAFRKAMKS